MNTLKDTLRDFTIEISKLYLQESILSKEDFETSKEFILDEYIERIKNELNINKYLQ